MHWLRCLPVARKFLYAFGVVCALCVALGIYTFMTLRSIAAKSADISQDSFPAVVDLANIRNAMNTVRREDLHLLLCVTPKCIEDEGPKRQQYIDSYHAAAKAYEPLISYPGERDLYQKISSNFEQYVEGSNRGMALMQASKTGDALDLFLSDGLRIPLETALTASQDDFDLNVKQGREGSQDATDASVRATWINAAVTALIVVLCALVGMLLTRVIAPRLTRVLAALEGLAARI